MVASSFIVFNDLCNRRVCPQGPTYQTNCHYYPTQNNLVSHITTRQNNRPQNYFQERTVKKRLKSSVDIYTCVLVALLPIILMKHRAGIIIAWPTHTRMCVFIRTMLLGYQRSRERKITNTNHKYTKYRSYQSHHKT